MTGITIARDPGYLSRFAALDVSIDNAGTITGTNGLAIAAGINGFSPYSITITNRSSGSLGAIAASFGTITNAGRIDGGSLSAIANPQNLGGTVSNSGTIQAEGAAATIAAANNFNIINGGTISNSGTGAAISGSFAMTNLAGGLITAAGADVVTGTYVQVTNSGTIANTAPGQAVSGSTLTITNNAGGSISGGSGGIAINAGTALTLVNTGIISGDVLAGSSLSNYAGSLVDSSLGTITGNLTFGNGANTLVATLNNGAVQTGVAGSVTGGAGTNTLQITTTADATLATSVALPVNFTQLSLAPASGTTLTLANGFSNPGTIDFTGAGTLTNAAGLNGNGQIISAQFGAAVFTNAGSITSANAGGPAAVALTGYASLINSGTITASGSGVSTYGSGVNNSGTITAGDTAVFAFVGNGTFANSGTIISTNGTAVSLSASCTCATETNSGTISGAQIGLQLGGGIIVNTGAITSPGYGVALSNYGTIENQAGGTITGGTAAIGSPNGAPGIAFVSNAGTINGNISLANGGFGTNTYYALSGGILNGNLTLGAGDTLFTDLAGSGGGSFGGINGTVTANNSNLVYNVAASTTTTAATPAGFGAVIYQLVNDPALTFTSATVLTSTLGLAGTGSVTFNGTVVTTDAAALVSQGFAPAPGAIGTPTVLAITNNGSIAATRTNANVYLPAAMSLGAADTLVNAGTITLTDSTGVPNSTEAAVSGGLSLTNTGTITGTGVGAASVSNGYYSGTQTLTNSGTLTSDQTTAIVNGTATIVNSGTIASSGGVAIGGPVTPYYYYNAIGQITNLAGGTISANADAIDLSGGMVSNAGTINGNVNLAYAPNGYQYSASAIYIDKGGTLNGNLTLGAFDALEIDLASASNGPLGGVTGTINANGAALVYMVGADATTTAASGIGGFTSQGYVLSNNAALTFGSGSAIIGTLDLAVA